MTMHACGMLTHLFLLARDVVGVHSGRDARLCRLPHRHLERLLQLRLEVVLLRRLRWRWLHAVGGLVLELLGKILQCPERLELKLPVPLRHHRLERHEVVHRKNLLKHLLASVGAAELLAKGRKVLRTAAHVGEVHSEQRFHHLAERVEDVNVCQLVLILRVEDDAVVVNEVPDWYSPLRTLKELSHGVEEPQHVCARLRHDVRHVKPECAGSPLTAGKLGRTKSLFLLHCLGRPRRGRCCVCRSLHP